MKRLLILGMIALILIFMGIFLLTKPKEDISARVILDGKSTDGVKEIIIDAKRFDFNPSLINLKLGEDVRFRINNLDTTHGIKIPEFGVSGNEVVEFNANKKGRFDFYCNNFCGEGHKAMKGKIIVE